jgi:phage terminase large subunit GpA-like protein
VSKVDTIIKRAIRKTHAPRSDLKSWQWADENIDYSRVPNYDTPYLSRFDSSRMPFWRQVLENLRSSDPLCKEVAVLKSSRSGFSEGVVLTDMRFGICEDPETSLALTATEDLALGFLDRRMNRGMGLNPILNKKFKSAKRVKEDIQFPDHDIRITWAANKSATKQDGFRRIYVDEIDLFPEGTIDAIRRRCSAYAMHHIVWGGSIDFMRKGDPNQSPILKLYEESDKQEWFMPDGKGGKFKFDMDGVKWSESCKVNDEWDLEEVARTAYFETPSGVRIEESERMDYVRKGSWESTSDKAIRRGYKVVALMTPFEDSSFGNIAKRFLSAKNRMNLSGNRHERQKNTLRTFFAEFFAEAHREGKQEVSSEGLEEVQGDYEIGNIWVPEKLTTGVFVTVDVQKTHVWWLARTWAYNAEKKQAYSSLLQCGNSATFADLDDTIGQFEPSLVGIDIGYALRQSEVADYCAGYTTGNPKDARVIALRGSDNLKAVSMDWQIRDAYEGRKSTGASPYLEYTWAVDPFRSELLDLMSGQGEWYIPKVWPDVRARAEYIKQVTSTFKADEEWQRRHREDHFWDCECEQLVLARLDGLI